MQLVSTPNITNPEPTQLVIRFGKHVFVRCRHTLFPTILTLTLISAVINNEVKDS